MSVLHGYNSAGKTTGRMSCPLMLHESRFCEQQFVSEVQPRPRVTGLATLAHLCNWSRLPAPFLIP